MTVSRIFRPVVCADCGNEFIPNSSAHKRCYSCKKKHRLKHDCNRRRQCAELALIKPKQQDGTISALSAMLDNTTNKIEQLLSEAAALENAIEAVRNNHSLGKGQSM